MGASSVKLGVDFRPNFVRTSSHLPKLRPNFVLTRPNFVQTSSRLRPNCVQTSCNLRPNFVRTSSELRPNFVRTSYKLRPNFVQTSSELRPNFVRTSSKLRPHFVRTSSTLRPNFVQTSSELRTISSGLHPDFVPICCLGEMSNYDISVLHFVLSRSQVMGLRGIDGRLRHLQRLRGVFLVAITRKSKMPKSMFPIDVDGTRNRARF